MPFATAEDWKTLQTMNYRGIGDCCGNCTFYEEKYEESNGMGHEQEYNCTFIQGRKIPVYPDNICDMYKKEE